MTVAMGRFCRQILSNFTLLSLGAFAFVLSVSPLSAQEKLLSPIEAAAIVASRAAAKDAEISRQLDAFEQAEILESRNVQSGQRTIIINSVKPLPLEQHSPDFDSEPRLSEKTSANLLANESLLTSETISLGANVYDNAHSEITWRDSETGDRFTVWSNISLNYLRPVSSIRSGEYDYLYFGFVTPITMEAEKARIASARALGVEVASDWKEPPVKFSDIRFEYAVITEDPSAVPAKLYRQMDALLAYYEAHHDSLEIAWKNAQTLQAARAAYLKENPPEPKTTRINFWKIESPAAGR